MEPKKDKPETCVHVFAYDMTSAGEEKIAFRKCAECGIEQYKICSDLAPYWITANNVRTPSIDIGKINKDNKCLNGRKNEDGKN